MPWHEVPSSKSSSFRFLRPDRTLEACKTKQIGTNDSEKITSAPMFEQYLKSTPINATVLTSQHRSMLLFGADEFMQNPEIGNDPNQNRQATTYFLDEKYITSQDRGK